MSQKFGGDDIDAVIQGGITFQKVSSGNSQKEGKVKTKAKKKAYITGSHGSASAKHKAQFRKK